MRVPGLEQLKVDGLKEMLPAPLELALTRSRMATIATTTMPPTTRRAGLMLVPLRVIVGGDTDQSGGAMGSGLAGLSGASGGGMVADIGGAAAKDGSEGTGWVGSARMFRSPPQLPQNLWRDCWSCLPQYGQNIDAISLLPGAPRDAPRSTARITGWSVSMARADDAPLHIRRRHRRAAVGAGLGSSATTG